MKTGFIVCGALGKEVKDIIQKQQWDAEIIGVSPEDHMFPMRIAPDVERRIEKIQDRCDRIVVVYGECGSRGKLDEVLKKHNIFRIRARNCYEMYAGKKYDQFLEEEIGTFFLTDFLVRTFHRAVIQGLGLDRYPELKENYFHNCTRIVYLIQNDSPQLRQEAQVIADFMGLPLHFYKTGCDNLENHLYDLINREEHRKGLPSYKTTCGWKNNLGIELLMCY